MRNKFLLGATALSLYFATNVANAQSGLDKAMDNVYLSIGAGLDLPEDFDLEVREDQSQYMPGGTTEIDLDPGFAILGAVGYNFPNNNFRTELELGYRKNDVDSFGGNSKSVLTSGDVEVYTAFANLIYDFAPDSRFSPYTGAGAGIALIKLDNLSTISGAPDDRSCELDCIFSFDNTEPFPAIQGIVGSNFAVSDNLDLFAEYHYVMTLHGDKGDYRGTSASQEFPNATALAELDDYRTHTILAGIRYTFGAPEEVPEMPAPVIPAYVPPVDVSRSYLVFFDFDKFNITQEAQDVLNQVAQDAGRGLNSKIIVTGHTDLAGSDQYNEGLSQRRANSVKSSLVSLGLDSGDISMIAKGESDPLLPTADGVPEAQNRRVEIVYTISEPGDAGAM